MAARFPHRKDDGSFSIQLDFESQATVESGRVDDWLRQWLADNSPWIRLWRGAEGKVVKRDTMRFMDAFLREPKCILSKRGCVIIQLDGRSTDLFWKDWMVRMIEDVGAGELGLRFVRARNSVSPSEPSEGEQ